jgi:diguanylate cyclase (GGDEF)-like protein/PAS domain S-box-containing protein
MPDSVAGIAMLDTSGNILAVNDRLCDLVDFRQASLVGRSLGSLFGRHIAAFFARQRPWPPTPQAVWNGTVCGERRDGTQYCINMSIVPLGDPVGNLDGYTAICLDIGEHEDALLAADRAGNTDWLTGLPNRKLFQERLEQVIVSANQDLHTTHIALLDLDSFKGVNDSYGHKVGDELLIAIARRLRSSAPPTLFVARIGGDEFALLAVDMANEDFMQHVDILLESLRAPLDVGPHLLRCSASVGVAACPQHGATAGALFNAADMALYHAKAMGRDQARMFISYWLDDAKRRAEIVQAAERGLLDGSFSLFYQPVVPNSLHKPFTLEGLLRWRHPQRGLLEPGAFLTALDEPGFQAAIGLHAVETAFRDLGRFVAQGLPVERIAVNATNADFRSDVFVDRFFDLSEKTGLPLRMFGVEVTEGVFLGRDYPHTERRLRRLQEQGVEIALDDFGTGYASLIHLRQAPIDRVKIDRSFVRSLAQGPTDRAIVAGILEIAHGLGKQVTAEGVETQEQAEQLLQMGCDALQGWLFARASSPDTLGDVLANLPQ